MNNEVTAILEIQKIFYFLSLEHKNKVTPRGGLPLGAMRTDDTFKQCPDDELLKAKIEDW